MPILRVSLWERPCILCSPLKKLQYTTLHMEPYQWGSGAESRFCFHHSVFYVFSPFAHSWDCLPFTPMWKNQELRVTERQAKPVLNDPSIWSKAHVLGLFPLCPKQQPVSFVLQNSMRPLKTKQTSNCITILLVFDHNRSLGTGF